MEKGGGGGGGGGGGVGKRNKLFSTFLWFYFRNIVQIVKLMLNFNAAPCISINVRNKQTSSLG
jgi:hypothetical protein